MSLKVSILIPIKNIDIKNGENISDLVADLLKQNYNNKEIIIIDSSDNETATNIKKSVTNQDVSYHYHKSSSLTELYRKSVEIASGDLCLFLSPFANIKDIEFISKHVATYTDPAIGAVTGKVISRFNKENNNFNNKKMFNDLYGWQYVHFYIKQPSDNISSLSIHNFSFLKRIYNKVKGFDTNYSGIDKMFITDFAYTLKENGYKVIYEPFISVHLSECIDLDIEPCPGSLATDAFKCKENVFKNSRYFIRKYFPLQTRLRLLCIEIRRQIFNNKKYSISQKLKLFIMFIKSRP